ncbi:MAG: hypothetical protein ACMUJM_25180 [bacterium]
MQKVFNFKRGSLLIPKPSLDERKELEESEPIDDNPDKSEEGRCEEEKDSKEESLDSTTRRKPGKQKGTQGHGRTINLSVTG